MNIILFTYFIYLIVSISLTVWVARTLFKSGRVFLVESFGTEQMADSVNRLLLVGFYLVNLGFVSVFLRFGAQPFDWIEAFEYITTKVGIVLVVLGGMHFVNMFNFAKIRSKSKKKKVSTLSMRR